eukprot:6619748-Pyramimonas_sp.AAC.1
MPVGIQAFESGGYSRYELDLVTPLRDSLGPPSEVRPSSAIGDGPPSSQRTARTPPPARCPFPP